MIIDDLGLGSAGPDFFAGRRPLKEDGRAWLPDMSLSSCVSHRDVLGRAGRHKPAAAGDPELVA
jgi:hypothetical protein